MPCKSPPNSLHLRSVLLKTLENSVGEVCVVVKCLGQAIDCLGSNISFLLLFTVQLAWENY